MTLQKSLSESLIKEDAEYLPRWQNIPHCMTDWGKILKVYQADSELILHLDGHIFKGHFYFFMFDFQQDPRLVIPVSEKTSAFQNQPSKN